MNMFYSKSTGGFYSERIHGSNRPSDCVEITQDTYIQMLSGQSKGKSITHDSEGHPRLVDQSFNAYVPSSITRAQGKAVLISSGLWSSVVDYVSSMDDSIEKELANVALNDTVSWSRGSPFLNLAAKHIGLTEDQLDDLFIEASKIEL